jgi:hypothetical protein
MSDQKPDDLSEDINKLEERKTDYEKWLESFRKARNIVPFVIQNIEITDWQIRALKDSPEEATEIPYPSNPNLLEQENKYLRNVFPPIQVPSRVSLDSTTSVATSGSTGVYEYVRRVGDLNTPHAINYSQTFGKEYQQLQEKQQRPNQVRALLNKFNAPNLLERFDRAYAAFIAYESKTGEPTAVAMEMRTLLDGIKGELFNKAKKWPEENITWDNMATRLAIGNGGGPLHIRLINQKRLRSSLIARLSDVGKDREGGSITNLEDIWTEMLDHIVTVLGMINL